MLILPWGEGSQYHRAEQKVGCHGNIHFLFTNLSITRIRNIDAESCEGNFQRVLYSPVTCMWAFFIPLTQCGKKLLSAWSVTTWRWFYTNSSHEIDVPIVAVIWFSKYSKLFANTYIYISCTTPVSDIQNAEVKLGQYNFCIHNQR